VTDRNFIGKKFNDEVIENEAFDEILGNYISFNNMKLINCSFKKADLASTMWINTTFEQNTNFKYCNLKEAVFDNATFVGKVDFSGSLLNGATFRDCRFLKSGIQPEEPQEKDGIDFSSCILRDSIFENCSFPNSDLRSAEFHTSSILNTDFDGSITWHTDFFDSEVRKSSFDSSVLEESSFLNAKISLTSFRNATLKKLSLESSVIEQSDFTGADTRTERFHRHLVGLQNDVSSPAYRFFPYDELIRTYKCQITNSVFDKSHLELFNLTTLDGCSLRGTFLPWICRWKTVDLPVRFTNSLIDNSTPPPNFEYFCGGTFDGSLISNCSWSNLDFAGCRTKGASFLQCDFENSRFSNSQFLDSIFENCNFQHAQFARGEKLRSSFEYRWEQDARASTRRHDHDLHIPYPVQNPTDWATVLTGSKLVKCNFIQSNFDLIEMKDFVLMDPRGISSSN
jgi:uncharacterized protein YjbI with pentapeptide repeats